MSDNDSKSTFFRESRWMVISNLFSGACMTLVHPVAAKMETAEYGIFYTLLRSLLILSIPAVALQAIFAQQTATVLDDRHRSQLSGSFRAAMTGIFSIWLVMLIAAFAMREQIASTLHVEDQRLIWVTMVVVLFSLWLPVLQGLLQGSQNFWQLGWVSILGGSTRLLSAIVIIAMLHRQSVGGMVAALIGQVVAFAVGMWWSRSLWRCQWSAPDWRKWFAQVLPLTLGPGAIVILSCSDALYVQSLFPRDEAPFYAPGQMIGFAMMQFMSPLVFVMFPKIVKSRARSETTSALYWALLSVSCMGGLAAVAVTLLPELPLRILYFTKPEFWVMAPLVPWFVWSMLILTLANVLLSNLLARKSYGVVPWLALIVVAYLATLMVMRGYFLSMERNAAFLLIIQILTGFNTLGFASVLLFTRRLNKLKTGGEAGSLLN